MDLLVHPEAFAQASERSAAALQLSENENAPAGICDGFRVPDQVVIVTRAGHVFELEALEAGSLISSNFWVGPADKAEQFFSGLTDAVRDALPLGLNADEGDCGLIGLWQEPGASAALLGLLGSGDWAASLSDQLEIQETMEAAGFIQVAFDGNDNYPEALLDELSGRKPAAPISFTQAIHNSIVGSTSARSCSTFSLPGSIPV